MARTLNSKINLKWITDPNTKANTVKLLEKKKKRQKSRQKKEQSWKHGEQRGETRIHTLWFHLYDILNKQKQSTVPEPKPVIVWGKDGEGNRLSTKRHEGIWGTMEMFYI